MSRYVIENGDEVRDSVTGLKGIVTGITEHLHGCRRMVIQAKMNKNKEVPDTYWVDEPQLVILKKRVIKSTNRTAVLTGGPVSKPKDRRIPKRR